MLIDKTSANIVWLNAFNVHPAGDGCVPELTPPNFRRTLAHR